MFLSKIRKSLLKLAICGLIPALSFSVTACGNYVVIDAKGSSSVQPFLASLGNDYSRNHKVEISVQAGGSSIGISSIANMQTTMGNASKSPKSDIAKFELEEKWRTNQLKTISIAKDAIGVVFAPPANTNVDDFVLSKNNIADLYTAFAGHQEVSLQKFYKGQLSQDYKVVPFARSGGATSSGTAEAFLKDSKLDKEEGFSIPDNVKSALNNGTYGQFTQQTNESNAEAYNNFKINAKNRPGSMIYLSLGYIENNMSTLKGDGFDVMRYQNAKSGETVEATRKNVESGSYAWMRPFNTIISLALDEKKLTAVKGFISWILFSKYIDSKAYETVQRIYDEQGLIELTDDELKKLFLLTDEQKKQEVSELVKTNVDAFWKSDFSFDKPVFGI